MYKSIQSGFLSRDATNPIEKAKANVPSLDVKQVFSSSVFLVLQFVIALMYCYLILLMVSVPRQQNSHRSVKRNETESGSTWSRSRADSDTVRRWAKGSNRFVMMMMMMMMMM